ncbi:MAG: DUF3048 domain-containing protein [Anaerolineae bacterium]|nr:DUF3048 domain-containing protein [Anaerolineae bacterium]MDK1080511.1 DUF3048 domain-containing protein [Anaerolineae bacterium]MDK1118790.1 DUF3048 domain-containing protein [Anaerolineae bacterium]
MLSSQSPSKKNSRLFQRLIFLITFLVLIGACRNATPKVDENLLLTPDINNPTATPFHPQNGTQESPYDPPENNSSLLPAEETTNSLAVGKNLLPTPFPSGYQGMPVYKLFTNTNPLTGLTVTNPEFLERRPIAIKITQYPRYVRPQSGLTLADVVYEYYIEDGLSRFIAVFFGNNAAMVGPVRSGRFFDEHVARMYQAFFVFKYADQRVYNYFKAGDLKNFLVVPGNGSCPPFFEGESDRVSYNNIFFNTYKFNDCIARRSGVENTRPPLRSSFFSSVPPASEYKVERIYTQYSSEDYNYWQYLPDENRYQRYQEVAHKRNGRAPSYAPLIDAHNNFPVMSDNVVVIFVHHRFANQFNEEDEVFHVDLYGSGDAIVFRDGIAVKATWHRNQLDQPIHLTTTLGAPVYLKPGVTFYQLIGGSSESWLEGSEWHFIWRNP